jgi:hypothetical protein
VFNSGLLLAVVSYSEIQCANVCCSMLQWDTVTYSVQQTATVCYSVLQ